MSDDQFMKLFKAIEDVKSDVRDVKESMATKSDVGDIQNQLDGIAARLDDDDTERAALEAKVDRHEGWVRQLADTTGLKLDNTHA